MVPGTCLTATSGSLEIGGSSNCSCGCHSICSTNIRNKVNRITIGIALAYPAAMLALPAAAVGLATATATAILASARTATEALAAVSVATLRLVSALILILEATSLVH